MQLVLLVLACFVGVALSQGSEEGRRCCIPQQFEGILHEAGGYYAKKYEKDGVFAVSLDSSQLFSLVCILQFDIVDIYTSKYGGNTRLDTTNHS